MTRRSRFVPVLLALAVLAGCDSLEPPTAPSSSPPPTTSGRHDIVIAGDGAVIGGVLYRPDTTTPRPSVIVVHGWLPAGTLATTTTDGRARRYADEGYVAVAVALRGWPPSGGADDCGLRQPDDVVRVAEWLRSVPGVQADRIGLVGFSQGGQVALLAGARDARLRAVVAYYPVTDVARWKTTTANADIPSYITAVCEPGGIEARSPLRHTAITASVLLVHGDADTRVPTEQSVLIRDALVAAGRRVQLTLVPGAQHGFTAAEEAATRPAVDAFLAAELR